MTFRSSWSGGRRKGHAGRQRGPPKSGGPGVPAPVRRAGVPRVGLRRGRPCTGPDRGHTRAGDAGTRGRGRRRTREAEPRPLLGPETPEGGAGQEGIPGREKRSPSPGWASPSGGRGISMAPAAGNVLGASRSPTSPVYGSRPEVARGSRLRLASRAASALHLRPSPGNRGSEGRRRAGRSRARPGAR